ncbi:MAG: ATP-binding protein [Dehalococcoidia bacterium]
MYNELSYTNLAAFDRRLKNYQANHHQLERQMANGAGVEFYIQHGKEERYLEYKGAMAWSSDNTKIEIAKAMMAMSNLRSGGVIVVGMKEVRRGVWEPDAMTDEQVASFTQDDIAQWVNDYAVPSVQFTAGSFSLDTNKFVIIKVREFDSVPTICRKQKQLGGRERLKRGAIYYRSNAKNESAPVSSDEDMRELIGLAVGKGVAGEIERLQELGFVAILPVTQEEDALKYEHERRGL